MRRRGSVAGQHLSHVAPSITVIDRLYGSVRHRVTACDGPVGFARLEPSPYVADRCRTELGAPERTPNGMRHLSHGMSDRAHVLLGSPL
jgi:hypothetical protein